MLSQSSTWKIHTLNSDRVLVTQGLVHRMMRKERTQTLSPSEYFNSLSLMASTMLSWRHSVVTSTHSRLRYLFWGRSRGSRSWSGEPTGCASWLLSWRCIHSLMRNKTSSQASTTLTPCSFRSLGSRNSKDFSEMLVPTQAVLVA